MTGRRALLVVRVADPRCCTPSTTGISPWSPRRWPGSGAGGGGDRCGRRLVRRRRSAEAVPAALPAARSVLERLHAGIDGERSARGRPAPGSFALINLPFVLLSPSGWAVAYRFQALREPNYDSLWGVLGTSFELDQGTITTLSTLAVIVVLAVVAWETERRARREGTYPFLPACAALLAGFLLVAKVHSPQYALWLVPLFVLVRIELAAGTPSSSRATCSSTWRSSRSPPGASMRGTSS